LITTLGSCGLHVGCVAGATVQSMAVGSLSWGCPAIQTVGKVQRVTARRHRHGESRGDGVLV